MDDIANSSEIVYKILEQTQLEKFWPKIRDDLQISRLTHFNYVKPKDFENIGISKPAVRRLLDQVKKVQTSLNKNNLPNKTARPISYQISSQKETGLNKQRSQSVNLTVSRNHRVTSPHEDTYSSTTPSFIINENDLQISSTVLGTGNFGIVRKAVWKMPSGEKVSVAAKVLHESAVNESTFSDLLTEISYMCNINHKNLIKLYGIVLSSVNGQNIVMVTELAPLGSLLNHLQTNVNKILINTMHLYFQQISYGMEYLESKRMIHRDLAARNILLFSSDKVKICDFGMMRKLRDTNDPYKIDENQKIPFPWYPPESLRKRTFSNKSDVWMFGITLWEICAFGERPWMNLTSQQILEKIEVNNERLPKPEFCSKKLYELLCSCWTYNSVDRPSFQYLTKLLREIHPIEMRSKQVFNEKNKLEIEKGDMITILDGCNDRHWWKGQNNRTLKVGIFPRLILDAQRRLTTEDISLPLKNSFIHTGHMGISNKKTWGFPDKIDEIFLSNPLQPPDLFSDATDNSMEYPNRQSVDSHQSTIKTISNRENLLVDLSDFSDASSNYNQSLSNETSGASQLNEKGSVYLSEDLNQLFRNGFSKPEPFYENFETNIESITRKPPIPSPPIPFNIPLSETNTFNPHQIYNIPIFKKPTMPSHQKQPIVDKTKFSIKPNDVDFDDYFNKVMQNVIEDFNKKPLYQSQPKQLHNIIQKEKTNIFYKTNDNLAEHHNQTSFNRNNVHYRETYF